MDSYLFSMGHVPGHQFQLEGGLPLEDFSLRPTAHSFIHSLRPICEVVFNLLLGTYIASLNAIRQDSQENNLRLWDEPVRLALQALSHTEAAEFLRQKNLIADADVFTEEAFRALKLRCVFCPRFCQTVT